MGVDGTKKDKLLCSFSILIILLSYASQRFVEYSTSINENEALIMSLVFTAALGVVVAMVSKIDSLYHRMLAALIGYKMMPPEIFALTEQVSYDGAVFYHMIRKVAVLIFFLLILRPYIDSENRNTIGFIPVLMAAVAVPFTTDMSNELGYYLTNQLGGSMIYYFFTQYIFYIFAIGAIFIFTIKSNDETFRFICHYEYVTIGINILRRCGLAATKLMHGDHISKNIVCWIVVYAACIAIFAIADREKKKAIKFN